MKNKETVKIQLPKLRVASSNLVFRSENQGVAEMQVVFLCSYISWF